MTVYDDTLTEIVNNSDVPSGLASLVVSDGLSLDELFPTVGNLHNTIVDNYTIAEILLAIKATPVVDGVLVGDSTLAALINNINDTLSSADILSSSASRSMSILENLLVSDTIQVALDAALSEIFTIDDSPAALIKSFARISELVQLSDSTLSRADMTITVSTLIALASFLSSGNQSVSVLEAAQVSAQALDIHKLVSSVLEMISLDDLSSNTVRLSVVYTDDILLDDASSNSADLFDILLEDVAFILSMDDGSIVYQGITMNPETYSVTEYDNYDFNSTTNFEGSYLLAGSTGLYLMGGSTDDGAYITSKIKTASMDFGTSNIKQCPKAYLGIDSDASLILRVSVDGKYTSTYQLDVDSQDLTTQIFDIGKGLKGRYWQFELQTKGNSSLILDEIELFPIKWGRKR